MKPEIIRADPAGNITIFVMNPPDGKRERAEIAEALIADPDLKAEQVGFVISPKNPGDLWQLEMAGGEFCGNASRSLGLLAALKSGLSGRHTITIKTSGITKPVPVFIDTGAQTAEIVIPGPLTQTEITLNEKCYPVYGFEGITHIIGENTEGNERLALSLFRNFDESRRKEGCIPCDALGVMFYDTKKNFMRPVVWVRGTAPVFESSCGSGSAALGVWAVRNSDNTDTRFDFDQPGGTITVRVIKKIGLIKRLSISGKVTLSEIKKTPK